MPENDVRMISIAGTQVGLAGLDSIFAELRAAGKKTSEELGERLVEQAGKENYIPDAARAEYARALLREYSKYLGEDVAEEKPLGLSIKILGMGCSSCESLASNVRSALMKLGMAADVEHVREPRRIAEYGVLGVPALVINGKVVSVGKVLSTEQVMKLLERGEENR